MIGYFIDSWLKVMMLVQLIDWFDRESEFIQVIKFKCGIKLNVNALNGKAFWRVAMEFFGCWEVKSVCFLFCFELPACCLVGFGYFQKVCALGTWTIVGSAFRLLIRSFVFLLLLFRKISNALVCFLILGHSQSQAILFPANFVKNNCLRFLFLLTKRAQLNQLLFTATVLYIC